MGLTIHIEPLDAMKIFYEGEESGVWEGEFIKNEKKRGLVFPPLVREFLQKYGYFNINKGNAYCFLPDDMKLLLSETGESSHDMLLIGVRRELFIGIAYEDCSMEDPFIYLGAQYPSGYDSAEFYWDWQNSGLSLNDFLTLLFIENLSAWTDSIVYNETEPIAAFLKKYGSGKDMNGTDFIVSLQTFRRPGYHICYDEDANLFIVLVLGDDGELMSLIPQGITTNELEDLFTKEFYQNDISCDFSHALRLLQEIISREENEEEDDTEKLRKYYQLAGRCCWALGQWEDGESWYQKSEALLKAEISNMLDTACSFYQGLGNFYHEKGDAAKSQAAYQEVDKLCKGIGENPRRTGSLIQQQAAYMAEENKLDEAIDLYSKALEEYGKDPKNCKYEITRCQQLRDELMHKKKE